MQSFTHSLLWKHSEYLEKQTLKRQNSSNWKLNVFVNCIASLSKLKKKQTKYIDDKLFSIALIINEIQKEKK